jgi:hypothetical protein
MLLSVRSSQSCISTLSKVTKYINVADTMEAVIEASPTLIPALVEVICLHTRKSHAGMLAIELGYLILDKARTSEAYYMVLKKLYKARLFDLIRMNIDVDPMWVVIMLSKFIFPMSWSTAKESTLLATDTLVQMLRSSRVFIEAVPNTNYHTWSMYTNLVLKYSGTLVPLDFITISSRGLEMPITLGLSCALECAAAGCAAAASAAACGEVHKTYRCTGCLSVKYCSKACQVRHRKQHRKACRFVMGADAPGTRFLRGEVGAPHNRAIQWRAAMEERDVAGNMSVEIMWDHNVLNRGHNVLNGLRSPIHDQITKRISTLIAYALHQTSSRIASTTSVYA